MILLSFDIEEFDMPFEYGRTISFDDQMAISTQGTREILSILKKHNVKATFFCTATFALAAPQLIKNIIEAGHEVASHGYFHSEFETSHLALSKQVLEQLTCEPVNGFRMARMMPVDEEEVYKAGYVYNSSINPTYLPGRYNNLKKPRTCFLEKSVIQLPASVSPLLRIPLFWLSFHNFPLWLYRLLCNKTYRRDGYLNIYFHPWEFTDLQDKTRFGFPGYVSKNSGKQMSERMHQLIAGFKQQGLSFTTITKFLAHKQIIAPVQPVLDKVH
ncbi:polysaccharide deacetylase family protein [Mucilaginibacter aquaedulcis]|uniref:polysaccharide deacetylase family protein n=1 Tax=Mucilaginibacter aquaedulcis TaxID=1187081 RepID=UPI0025B459B4|nr:polysaccharide deacetylase family protein [Mucilaginibacter aquaedulcis]MDN3551275.1 polysaccharide deacetylase family protein [Mucilaginibacter aquaedulcis]